MKKPAVNSWFFYIKCQRKFGDEMAKKKGNTEIITMQCETCKRQNYTTVKNRKNNPDRLERKKYCKFDRKHTVHKEKK